MKEQGTVVGERDLEALAWSFQSEGRERAAESEAQRCVPPDFVDRIRHAGLLKLFLPKSLGGLETDPLTALKVVEIMSQADGSLGWTIMILNGTLLYAWLEADVAHSILGPDPDVTVAGNLGPLARATPTEMGIRLDGRWPFCSGSPHAGVLLGGYFTFKDDKPMVNAMGQPDWRIAFFPRSDGEIVDTWHTSGLRGTASNDIIVSELPIAQEMTIAPFGPPLVESAFIHWSLFSVLGVLMCGVPLGVGRRALDEVKQVVERKSRAVSGQVLAGDPSVLLAVAQADAQLRSARAFLVECLGAAWDTSLRGDDLTLDQRALLRLSYRNAMDAGIHAVDTAFRLGGGSAIYEHNPLQRCWRDLHAGKQHIFFSDQYVSAAARARFGLPTDEWLF
jgi:alkylation response protein AidB-like acyl-CoA dehydrogenase